MTLPVGHDLDLEALFQRVMDSGEYTCTLAELGIEPELPIVSESATVLDCLLANQRTDLLLPLCDAIRAHPEIKYDLTQHLSDALYHHNREFLQYLLTLKPSQETQNRALDTAILRIGRHDMLEALQPRLEAWKPDTTPHYPPDLPSPLFLAILYGGEAVPALLRLGAQVDVQDARGYTPFLAASSRGLLPAVQALVAAGADIHATTLEGENALYLVVHRLLRPQSPLINYLLHLGVDPLQPTSRQMTALDLARQSNETAIVKQIEAFLRSRTIN